MVTLVKMLQVMAIELRTHLSGYEKKKLSNNALTLSISEMYVLVPKTSFYNETRNQINQLLFGSREEGVKGSSKEPTPGRGSICCWGLGEEGKKWTNKKVLEEINTLHGHYGYIALALLDYYSLKGEEALRCKGKE